MDHRSHYIWAKSVDEQMGYYSECVLECRPFVAIRVESEEFALLSYSDAHLGGGCDISGKTTGKDEAFGTGGLNTIGRPDTSLTRIEAFYQGYCGLCNLHHESTMACGGEGSCMMVVMKTHAEAIAECLFQYLDREWRARADGNGEKSRRQRLPGRTLAP